MLRTSAPKYNIYRLVLHVLILCNLLELFVSRGMFLREGADDNNQRVLIQGLNGLCILIMTLSLLLKMPYKKSALKIGIYLFFIYSFVYFVLTRNIDKVQVSNYLRLLMNLEIILFFYKGFLEHSFKRFDFRLYTITLIISVGKKLFESYGLLLEYGQGGDYITITLVFTIPLILIFFEGKYSLLLILLSLALIAVSLRRSCIIAVLIGLPFVYAYISQNINKTFVFMFFVFLIFVGLYFFYRFEDLILLRFNDLFEADTHGNYGSSRSDFYSIIWNDYLNNPQYMLFGKGLGSVANFYHKNGYPLSHAHNDFLEIIYTFGLLGISIWALIIIKYLKLAFFYFKYNKVKSSLLFYIIVTYLIVGVTSGTILRNSLIPMLMTLAILSYNNVSAVKINVK